MPDINHFARFHVQPERLYGAITVTDYLREWWMHEAELEANAAGTSRLDILVRNIEARVRFEDRRPPTSVRWKTIPISSRIPGWEGTSVTFDLRAAAGATLLRLTHGGFERADDDYDRTTASWASCLLGLQRHLEAGAEFTPATSKYVGFPAVGNLSRPPTRVIER